MAKDSDKFESDLPDDDPIRGMIPRVPYDLQACKGMLLEIRFALHEYHQALANDRHAGVVGAEFVERVETIFGV